MECDICHRPFKGKRQPTCASCVRATLYGPRIEQASALLDRENAHTHAEAIIRPGNDGVLAALPEDADWDAIQTGIKSHSVERAKAEQQATEARIKDITSKADELRQQIEQYRALAAKQKEENAQRRTDIAAKKTELQKQRVRATEPVELTIKKAGHRLNKTHGRMMEARECICKVCGSLSQLKKHRGRDGRSQFWLGGIPIPDLRDINGSNGRLRLDTIDPTSDGNKQLYEPHELISAALNNVCRLLGIICHYLSIRLPAEIILPHNNFPHAAILPRDSSYKSGNPHFQRTFSNSPVASQLLQRSEFSRPRLLQLDRPFPQLQKDDSKAAAFFREGVVLLAYNVAWLCRTQGVGIGSSFDDICDIGRNLYELIPRQDDKRRPNLRRNLTSATDKTDYSATPDAPPKLGSHSHGSLHHSLAGYEGNALFGQTSTWDVSIHKLTDQLKSYLRREAARAEWDFIDTTEWDEELEDERPVFVGGARRSLDGKGPAMSVMTVKPSDDVADDRPGEGGKGWMKIRGRGGE